MDSDFNEVWLEYASKIKSANERFAETRQKYFVDLVEERIGDFPAIVLTLERYLLITLGGVFSEEADKDGRIPVIRFLWFVSPDFDPDPSKAFKFIRANQKVDAERYLPLIRDYLKQAFAFAQSSGKKEKKVGADIGASSDWASTIIDQIAFNYHWSEKEILKLPLPRIFLYLEKIRQRQTGNAIYSCKEADDLKQEFMDKVNNRMQRN